MRTIVLPQSTAELLRRRKETSISRWIFPNPVMPELPVSPGAAYSRLKTLLKNADLPDLRFHDLRHKFATLAMQNGVDVKTLSAMLGHVSSATTLDIYTHITDDMRHSAAANIDHGIGKAEPQDGSTSAVQPEKPRMTDFKPYTGHKRKPGTGCMSKINDYLYEGRYSPMWPDGKKHAKNVYAKTSAECEEKLKALIAEMRAEIAEAKAVVR